MQSPGNVGKLFSRILTKHIETLSKEKYVVLLDKCITITELIEWKVWSNMLKVANGKCDINYFVFKGPTCNSIQRLSNSCLWQFKAVLLGYSR